MRSLALCFVALTALLSPASAEDCDAERSTSAQRIRDEVSALNSKLDLYEATVLTGNMRAFDEASQSIIDPWESLLTTVSRERQRLAAPLCPLQGIPDEALLPPDWDTVRDIGVLHVIEIDRAIVVLNHQAGITRKPIAQGFARN